MVAAELPEAYRAAVDRLLGHLGDPVTRTVPPEGGGAGAGAGGAPAGGGTAAGELAVHRAGGVAVAVVTDYDRVAAPDGGATLRRLLEEAADAEALVFDLRRLRGGTRPAWWVQQALAEVLPRLIDRPVPTAGRRHRLHSGHRPQRGFSTGGYYAAVVVEQGQLLLPAPAPWARRPLAFVLNAGSAALQPALAGLQAAGLATVVWEGPPDAEAGVAVSPVTLAGGLRARVRRDELVAPDGRAGFRPDAFVPELEAVAWPDNAAVAAAVEAVRRAPAARPAPEPAPERLGASRRAGLPGADGAGPAVPTAGALPLLERHPLLLPLPAPPGAGLGGRPAGAPPGVRPPRGRRGLRPVRGPAGRRDAGHPRLGRQRGAAPLPGDARPAGLRARGGGRDGGDPPARRRRWRRRRPARGPRRGRRGGGRGRRARGRAAGAAGAAARRLDAAGPPLAPGPGAAHRGAGQRRGPDRPGRRRGHAGGRAAPLRGVAASARGGRCPSTAGCRRASATSTWSGSPCPRSTTRSPRCATPRG